MATSSSLLLVKPDGMASEERLKSVYRWITKSDLEIIEQRDVEVPAGSIADIWPKFAGSEHRFAAKMLERYLGSSRMRAIFVRSSSETDVIAQCRLVRNRVREEFGDSMFANVVHTPGDENERVGNLRFFKAMETGENHTRHFDDSAGEGRFGRFAEVSDETMSRIVDSIWNRTAAGNGWEWLRRTSVGPATVWLLPGSDNSVDFEISAVCDSVPGSDVEWCAHRFIEAEIFGRSPIDTIDLAAMRALAERLTGRGVKVELDDKVQSDDAVAG